MTAPADTNTIDPVDLEALKRQVARLEATQAAGDSEKAATAALFSDGLYPEPTLEGFSGAQARAQNALLDVRRRAAEQVGRENETQLAAGAGKRKRLEQKLLELAAQRQEEEERHRAALAPLDRKCDEIRREHDGLFKPVALETVMARPEFVAEIERINREWTSEQLPIGTGVTVEQVIAARQRMVGVRG